MEFDEFYRISSRAKFTGDSSCDSHLMSSPDPRSQGPLRFQNGEEKTLGMRLVAAKPYSREGGY